MGIIFKESAKFLSQDISNESIFVEIGSDRHEGSTVFFDNLALQYNKKFYSIDIVSSAKERLGDHLRNTTFVISDGVKWSEEFNKSQGLISLLYLDNFDYIWNVNENPQPDFILEQKKMYASLGVEMNNVNCQVSHFTQMKNLVDRMDPNGVIIFDDTYLHNDCWIGKGGPSVILLLSLGWKIVFESTSAGSGLIMKRVN